MLKPKCTYLPPRSFIPHSCFIMARLTESLTYVPCYWCSSLPPTITFEFISTSIVVCTEQSVYFVSVCFVLNGWFRACSVSLFFTKNLQASIISPHPVMFISRSQSSHRTAHNYEYSPPPLPPS